MNYDPRDPTQATQFIAENLTHYRAEHPDIFSDEYQDQNALKILHTLQDRGWALCNSTVDALIAEGRRAGEFQLSEIPDPFTYASEHKRLAPDGTISSAAMTEDEFIATAPRKDVERYLTENYGKVLVRDANGSIRERGPNILPATSAHSRR